MSVAAAPYFHAQGKAQEIGVRPHSATLTSKGQFTLPRDIREAMGVKPGDKIEMFVTREGETIMRALNKPASAILGSGANHARSRRGDDARKKAVAGAVAMRGRSGEAE